MIDFGFITSTLLVSITDNFTKNTKKMITADKTLIQSTKEKLIEKLKPSGWAEILRVFLHSQDFDKILEKLHNEVVEDRRFTPGLKNVFRAFEECPWDKTQVVVIGQDPYFTIGVADGIAFSCGETRKAQPSLRYMLEGVNRTVPYEYRNSSDSDPDLTRWANQGVLLLNSSFTVQIGKPGTHYAIWNEFILNVIDQIDSKKENVVFVLLGKQAESFRIFIHNHHHVVIASHPASAAYKKQNEWDGDWIFNKINDYLIEHGKNPIIW
jgi:uracil-DNA glycosylase